MSHQLQLNTQTLIFDLLSPDAIIEQEAQSEKGVPMRKIVLACTVAGAALAMTACSEEAARVDPAKPEPTAVAAEATTEEKAEVDALGSDLVKLAEAVDTSTGLKQIYAEDKLTVAFGQATDAEAVNSAFSALDKPGKAKIAAMAAQARLKK